MKKKVLIGTIILALITAIIGVGAVSLGNAQKKDYYENSITCVAQITYIDTDLDSSGDSGIYYDHTYYGTYTVNDKEYTNIEILKTETNSSTPEYSVGDRIKIRVLKEDPSKLANRGTTNKFVGYAAFATTVLIVVLGVVIYRNIKEETPQRTLTEYKELSASVKEDITITRENTEAANKKINKFYKWILVCLLLVVAGCFVKIIAAFNAFIQPVFIGVLCVIAWAKNRKVRKSLKTVPDDFEDYDKLKAAKNNISAKIGGLVAAAVLSFFVNILICSYLHM